LSVGGDSCGNSTSWRSLNQLFRVDLEAESVPVESVLLKQKVTMLQTKTMSEYTIRGGINILIKHMNALTSWCY